LASLSDDRKRPGLDEDCGSGLHVDNLGGISFDNGSEDSFSLGLLVLRNNPDLLGGGALGLNDLSGLSDINLVLSVDLLDDLGDLWDNLDDLFGRSGGGDGLAEGVDSTLQVGLLFLFSDLSGLDLLNFLSHLVIGNDDLLFSSVSLDNGGVLLDVSQVNHSHLLDCTPDSLNLFGDFLDLN